MLINILNLKRRTDRREAVTSQMESQGCSYRFWDGIEGKIPKQNISQAFKQVVRHYRDYNISYCCIAEDDLVFTGNGSWKYFLKHFPADFDLYTASYYSGSHDEHFRVNGFRGMTLVVVHKRFYETFLALPETRHIDGAISDSGAKVVVCPQFCAIQAPGYSDQRKRAADDSIKLKGKKLFGV